MTEVVAALIWDKDKFMICQRPAHKARGLLWEFVGGKVELGETKEQALIRECQEELAITLSVGDVFMDVVHEYPDINVHLTLFNATITEGVPQKLEHNDIKWITPSEISNYEFCPADEEILRRIIDLKVTECEKTELNEKMDADQLDNNEGNFVDELKEKIKYLSDNIGAITWISTVFVAIVGVILKLYSYARERGIVTYWRIDQSNVSVSGDNIFYDIAFSVAVSIILGVFMLIPFFIVKSKQKTIYKVLEFICLYIVFGLANFISINAWQIIKNNIFVGIVAFLIVNSILFFIIFSPSIFYLIPISTKKNQPSAKKLVLILIAAFLISLLYSYVVGYVCAYSNHNFRITENGYAIVYETDENFFLAKYDENSNKIDKNNQMVIGKENVSYTWVNIK